jgi:hypothetical protein
MADPTGLSEIVRRTVQANAKFYKGWLDLSVEYFRGISAIFGGATAPETAVPEMDSGAGAIVLEGEAGSLVRGAFLVTNDMERGVSCVFVASDFQDPVGVTVVTKSAFEPATVELAPGEQRVIQVAMTIDDKMSPGVGYAGEISIRGMDGFAVPVVLRRQHRIDEVPVRETQSGVEPNAGEPNATRPSRRKPAAKKGRGKKTAR